MLRLSLAAAVLAATLGPARAEETVLHLARDGLPRNAIVVVPDDLSAPAPVVFVLHGVVETGPTIRAVTDRQFEAWGAEHGWVIVYPSAYLRVWTVGEGPGARRLLPVRDDLGYLDALLAEVEARVAVDPARVFAAGFSQGGIVSLSWACKRPGRLRAVAVVGMALPAMLTDDCAAHPPEGVQIIHGTADRIVPFDGGPLISGPAAWMTLLSHDDSVDFFRTANGCAGPPGAAVFDSQDDGTAVTRRSWTGCARGAVEAWRIDGGAHRWPNGLPESPFSAFILPVTREFDGTTAVVDFFARFR